MLGLDAIAIMNRHIPTGKGHDAAAMGAMKIE